MSIYKALVLMVALALGGVAPSAFAQAEQAALTVVNINTASVDELATLKGIGKQKAQAIVVHREKFGEFKTVDEITDVKGIGKGILQKNAGAIVVE